MHKTRHVGGKQCRKVHGALRAEARLDVRELAGANALDESDLVPAQHDLLVVVRVIDRAQRRPWGVSARQELLQPAARPRTRPWLLTSLKESFF